MALTPKKILASLRALFRVSIADVREELFREQLRAAFPTTHFDWPLKLQIDDLSALELGANCSFGAFSEIVVLQKTPFSPVPGRLVVGDGVRLGQGSNIRAAGGTVTIGRHTQIGQHVSVIASNHLIDKTTLAPIADRWDTERTGVTIGDNCWIGAGAILLPGVTIGREAVIGAGSVVTKSVGERQVWFGNPARPFSPGGASV